MADMALGMKANTRRRRGKASSYRPSRADLLAASGNTVPDVIAPGLRILFCGINPGLYSAWARHHFARPGNRFWPALFAGGFTERLFRPEEESELLGLGYGITNLAARATVGSNELSREELEAGGRILVRKIRKYRPEFVAVLGVSAFRAAFKRPEATIGELEEEIEGARVWVLPSPSGLNAHFTPKALAELFTRFRREAGMK
jgi:double-stranded uracil-DNA glycosylase